MTTKKHEIHAVANVTWKNSSVIGKKLPPPESTRFAATARFIEDAPSDLFSIVVYYPLVNEEQRSIIQVDLHFLAPEIVFPRLKAGSRLYITDGLKVVADATIIRVSDHGQ